MRILYVGNSFTGRNNLPGLVARLAEGRGVAVEHRLISAGGAALRQHLNAGIALEAMASGGYDVVVLQEQSTLPGKNAAQLSGRGAEVEVLAFPGGHTIDPEQLPRIRQFVERVARQGE